MRVDSLNEIREIKPFNAFTQWSHLYCLSPALCQQWYDGSIKLTGVLKRDQTNRGIIGTIVC